VPPAPAAVPAQGASAPSTATDACSSDAPIVPSLRRMKGPAFEHAGVLNLATLGRWLRLPPLSQRSRFAGRPRSMLGWSR
jgi:hypothetical protein